MQVRRQNIVRRQPLHAQQLKTNKTCFVNMSPEEWKKRMDTIRFMAQKERNKKTSHGQISVRDNKLYEVTSNVLFHFDDEEKPFPFGKHFQQFTISCLVNLLSKPQLETERFILAMVVDLAKTREWMITQDGYTSILNNTRRIRDWVKGEPGITAYEMMADQLEGIRQTILFQSEYVRGLARIPFNLHSRFMSTFRLNLLHKVHPAHLIFMLRTHYPVNKALMEKEMLVFDDATGTIELVQTPKKALLDVKYSVHRVLCSSPTFQGMVLRWSKKTGEVNKIAMDVFNQEVFGRTLLGTVILFHDCED